MKKMDWLDQMEQKLALSTWVNGRNEPRVSAMSPNDIAKLIVAVRVAKKVLELYAAEENYRGGHRAINGKPWIGAKQVITQLQTGDFSKEDM